MKFQVMNRMGAADYSTYADIPKTIIISITDVNADDNVFQPNAQIIDILRLKFDDVEINEHNHITKDDGRRIIDFVNQHINDVEQIVVHCEGGVSRSAGVCAALMKIINGNDWEIFKSGYYCPNMTCYRTVLETYYGSYDQAEADEKITYNIKQWRKLNELD